MSGVELKGLKGLGSLIIDAKTTQTTHEKVEKLPLNFLIPGKYQPRKTIDDTMLQELADSIKAQGIIQPLIVRKIEQCKYEIIAGERRWRAAEIAGLADVPAIVREIEDNVAFAVALIENIQRENLNPLEEAMAFSRFHDEFSMTHNEIAHMVGRSRVSVTNTLRLLSLEPGVKRLLEEGKLDMGHARALLTLDPKQQLNLAFTIVNKQLNVRETEKLANSAKYPGSVICPKEPLVYRDKCKYWSHELSLKFSTKVSVKLNAKGTGKVMIEIDSPGKIDWLIDHIKID